MSLITLDHVSFSYGSIVALRDVTLTLPPGTIGLVGNNGAGKSTLLKVLLGLLVPDSGDGEILGCDLRHATRQLRGRVGYMPEAAGIVPLLKGVEFVALSGELYGMSRRDAHRRAHEVLNYVGLGELRYRRLEEYSTGNLQRLKLAAALVHDPQLLLLDEPTNGLDPTGRAAMLRLLEDLIAETNKNLILCTHLLGDIERLCEQVVVMHRGQAIRAGRLADLRSAAADCYELAWHGDPERFPRLLTQAAISVATPPGQDGNRRIVTVPATWRTREFFEMARAAEATLTCVRLVEEDLEQLFYRVTEGEAAT